MFLATQDSLFFFFFSSAAIMEVDRDLASLLVMNNSNGSYLLRRSKTHDELVLSLNYYGNVRHILVAVTNDGVCYVEDDEDTYMFRTVQHFIDYFAYFPLYLIGDKEPIKLTEVIDTKTTPVYV